MSFFIKYKYSFPLSESDLKASYNICHNYEFNNKLSKILLRCKSHIKLLKNNLKRFIFWMNH